MNFQLKCQYHPRERRSRNILSGVPSTSLPYHRYVEIALHHLGSYHQSFRYFVRLYRDLAYLDPDLISAAQQLLGFSVAAVATSTYSHIEGRSWTVSHTSSIKSTVLYLSNYIACCIYTTYSLFDTFNYAAVVCHRSRKALSPTWRKRNLHQVYGLWACYRARALGD